MCTPLSLPHPSAHHPTWPRSPVPPLWPGVHGLAVRRLLRHSLARLGHRALDAHLQLAGVLLVLWAAAGVRSVLGRTPPSRAPAWPLLCPTVACGPPHNPRGADSLRPARVTRLEAGGPHPRLGASSGPQASRREWTAAVRGETATHRPLQRGGGTALRSSGRWGAAACPCVRVCVRVPGPTWLSSVVIGPAPHWLCDSRQATHAPCATHGYFGKWD